MVLKSIQQQGLCRLTHWAVMTAMHAVLVAGMSAMAQTPVAQSSTAPRPLGMDLRQVYEAALEQDATIRAARAAADAGRERLPQARAQLLPSVSIGAGRATNRLATTAPNSLGVENTTHDSYFSDSKTLSVRQSLVNMSRYQQVMQAKSLVDEAEATLNRELQSLVVRVAGVYFEALLTDYQLDLVRMQISNSTAMLDAARKGLAAGSGTRTDIDEAMARLDMARAQELEARQNQDFARRQLEVLVNQPVPVIAKLDVPSLRLLPPVPSSVEEWIEMAEQRSPEMKVAQARLEAARREVSKAQAGHYPTLDAIAQWSDNGSENITRINSRFENKTIGLQLNVPLYAGGYVSSTVRQALADQMRVEETLEALRRDLGVRVHKEFRGVTEGILRVRALEQAARSTEQLLISSRKSLQAGSRTQLDVLNAQQQYTMTLRDLAQARHMFLISRVRLTALAGQDARASVDEVNGWLMPDVRP